MKKFVCTVCGYVYEGETAPEVCPVCKAPASKFKEQSGEKTWAAEHVVGVAKGVPEDILADLSYIGCMFRLSEAYAQEDADRRYLCKRK